MNTYYSSGRRVFDPGHRLVTSWAFSPRCLFFVRFILAVYTTCTSVFVLLWSAEKESGKTNHPEAYLSYFTHLSWCGLVAYFWASGLQTFAFSRRPGRPFYPLQHWQKPLQFLHVLLHTTVTTFPFLVTTVYWALLASPSTFATPYSAWSNISQHILNSVFALFEIIFTNVAPSPWTHLPITLVILIGYLAIAYITRATQGFYPYSFLDPTQSRGWKLAAYILGIALAQCVAFIMVYGLSATRDSLLDKFRKRGSKKVLEDDDGIMYYPLQPSDLEGASVFTLIK